MPEEMIPRRGLPEFKISKEQAEEVRAVSAITKMLADDPELSKKIAGAFVEASRAEPKDRLVTQIELKEKVTRMVAEKLKDVPAAQVARLYPYWYVYIIQYWIPRYWIPDVTIWQPWYYER